MNDTKINLIRRDVGKLREFTAIEDLLRRSTWWFLGGLLVSGVVIGGLFLFVRARVSQLEQEKARVVREINAQSTKEGLLLSLKERVNIASRALDSAKPWGKLFSMMQKISGDEFYNSISIEDSGRVQAVLNLPSVDEAVLAVTNMMGLSLERSLRSPQMLSFTLRDTGNVQLEVSFYPVF